MARRNAHDRSESPARSVVSKSFCACCRFFAQARTTVTCSCLPTMPKAKPTPTRLDAWARSEVCTFRMLGKVGPEICKLVPRKTGRSNRIVDVAKLLDFVQSVL